MRRWYSDTSWEFWPVAAAALGFALLVSEVAAGAAIVLGLLGLWILRRAYQKSSGLSEVGLANVVLLAVGFSFAVLVMMFIPTGDPYYWECTPQYLGGVAVAAVVGALALTSLVARAYRRTRDYRFTPANLGRVVRLAGVAILIGSVLPLFGVVETFAGDHAPAWYGIYPIVMWIPWGPAITAIGLGLVIIPRFKAPTKWRRANAGICALALLLSVTALFLAASTVSRFDTAFSLLQCNTHLPCADPESITLVDRSFEDTFDDEAVAAGRITHAIVPSIGFFLIVTGFGVLVIVALTHLLRTLRLTGKSSMGGAILLGFLLALGLRTASLLLANHC
jgi:hypothetical protein